MPGNTIDHVTSVRFIECALILEDALVAEMRTVGEFMVRGPVIAAPWHPLSFVRQAMLSGSFSFLPVRVPDDHGDGWRLISDVALARALRTGESRAARLAMSLEEAVASGVVVLQRPRVTTPDADVEAVAADLSDLPVLVRGHDSGELVGILTAFDLL